VVVLSSHASCVSSHNPPPSRGGSGMPRGCAGGTEGGASAVSSKDRSEKQVLQCRSEPHAADALARTQPGQRPLVPTRRKRWSRRRLRRVLQVPPGTAGVCPRLHYHLLTLCRARTDPVCEQVLAAAAHDPLNANDRINRSARPPARPL